MQPTASAVIGTVEAGPIRPVIMVGDNRPNTRPVAGAMVEALHGGNVLATTTTDDAGRYGLRVPPGTHLIRATAKGLHSTEPGKTVTVSPGETLTIRFVLDTGIRCRWGHQPATCPLGARCRWAKQAGRTTTVPERISAGGT
jgi:Carboxypeptidase regulatory-like domain